MGVSGQGNFTVLNLLLINDIMIVARQSMASSPVNL